MKKAVRGEAAQAHFGMDKSILTQKRGAKANPFITKDTKVPTESKPLQGAIKQQGRSRRRLKRVPAQSPPSTCQAHAAEHGRAQLWAGLDVHALEPHAGND